MNRKRYGLVFHISWVLLLLFHSIGSAQPVTIMVSVDSNGVKGANTSSCPSISADGRYVVFQSSVSNLTANNDTNGASDIFVRNRLTGQTTLVSISVDPSGNTGNGSSYSPSISVDGNFVAFCSQASNLVANDTNNAVDDIFVHDLKSGQTTMVSVDPIGNTGNGYSYSPSISADGRYVAFTSYANNLVAGDTNNTQDIFIRDRQTMQTTRVSVASYGTEGNGRSYSPSISVDGRYVAFSSDASNLVPGDTNSTSDIFVRDRQIGITPRVGIASDGTEANGYSTTPSISADGRYVAFTSYASNLVSGDNNSAEDVFVHDFQTREITIVSVDSSGNQVNGQSYSPSISADGSYVAFSSDASNLVPGDINSTSDIFVRDRQTGKTLMVSVDFSGTEGNGQSYYPSISADGRFVAFSSDASNLVSGDINGAEDVFVRGSLFDFPWAMFLPTIISTKP